MTEYVDLIYPGVTITIDVTRSEGEGLLDPQETTGDTMLEVEHAFRKQKIHLIDSDGHPVIARTRPLALRFRRGTS